MDGLHVHARYISAHEYKDYSGTSEYGQVGAGGFVRYSEVSFGRLYHYGYVTPNVFKYTICDELNQYTCSHGLWEQINNHKLTKSTLR